LLVETTARLEKLAKIPAKDVSAATKALREVLEERKTLLKDWDEALKAYYDAANPEPSPEQQKADARNDLERVTTLLAQAAKDPSVLLPAAFRASGNALTDANRSEMKDAIDAARNDVKESKSKLEKAQTKGARKTTHPLAALQAERDRIHQRVASLAPRRAEREAAVKAAKTNDERLLATERLTNFEWEARVETIRLYAQEGRIALETKLADVAALNLQVDEARVTLATQTLRLMQTRYQALTERKERDLKQAAVTQQKRAASADDPLERYHARRLAELLELEAQVLKNENASATSASPSLEEQRSLADRADSELAGIKHLLDDGRVSQLDALRLNNDFRRIGPQKSRIVHNELAATTRQLAFYDNALTGAEFDLFQDQRTDEYEHETVLEQLPAARHAEAKALFAQIEARHVDLLNRNLAALERLAERAEQTHEQILRRLRLLDEQYGFICTHIFWVRDQEAIGPAALAQGERDALLVGKSIFRLVLEAGDRSSWGRISAEFVAAALGLVILAWPLRLLHRRLERRHKLGKRWSVGIRGIVVGVGTAAVWPSYLGLLAYTARQAPWPRSVAVPVSAALALVVPAALAAGVSRWLLRPGGWAETVLKVPTAVACQVRRAIVVLLVGGTPLLVFRWLLAERLIAPGGRPIAASTFSRFLGLGFMLIVWGVLFYLLRGRSALMVWLPQFPERLGWLNRHRRTLCWSALALAGGVVVLDAVGYSFTAGRLTIAAAQGLGVLGFCWVLYRLLLRAIENHAWRWIRVRHAAAAEPHDDTTMPTDLAHRLKRLTGYAVPVIGIVLAAWTWDIDWALFRFLGAQELWHMGNDSPVKVRDLARCTLILTLTVAVWRHMSTFFALAVFPRMRDDPGVRFAVVTLCRYVVLGVGLLAGLSAVHLGLEKIGMVLAALGVGLGFGLQEIVSNFVCGIILLLERPIRVGDIVTVSGMSGKVERINIRATTITNGDNQSIIVPNRAFITSDLVNWTLKDKILRVAIKLKVGNGTDMERVSELLLNIAREDPDVLLNPVPSAFMEDFCDSALSFALYVHVPDPSLGSRVRHRLFAQIQKRFAAEGIAFALPMHHLRLESLGEQTRTAVDFSRLDPPSPTPPAPRLATTTPAPVPQAVEDCHRGVDE
jgi:potassium efflux system protein